jgi:predicted short-subunit dehydrogenase-like oxidoreductase (DUF2520 family)
MKVSRSKIVIIGAGNVATHLGIALKNSKHTIVQIYSKHKSSARKLANSLKCDYTNFPEKINSDADVYIIAVNDDSIVEVASLLKLNNKIVVHTSGSVELNVLKPTSKNFGVFYPLQTFSKNNHVDFKSIPVCIEASNRATLITLQLLAKSISNNVQKINSEQRKVIHLAAVFANNFSNHLYTISSSILSKANISFDILKPLIEETAKKIKGNHPVNIQTGPAVRHDIKTMNSHLKMLSDNKEYSQLYKMISSSISDSTKSNNTEK